ncbi:helix-turn-helix domain-containing protein [Streptomyces sp. 110]|uniref:Helix-turn-helix domain-containing protein n=1 Tax=Streptomyces endocoffeicus TaxID=2898945 RepID=A0ABS1PXT6_9ACTN|nr:helix-turn-helix transcriptional regulator [Streptomyces endocoffeicus]MBL1117253.1 helix-turn-helix domain-containing protein [Streptomyces endocoffeicus]
MDDATHGKSLLGEFLSTRRARLKPADVGLPDYGDRRRVPGLRREELAQLAGVSVAYYIRLEQGLSLNASPQVLDALATALRLDDAERRHLHTLSGDSRQRRRRLPAERVTAAVRQLVDAFGDSPVVVVGRRSDVLTWNRAGHALFAGHLAPDSPDQAATRPNTARLVFLDAHTRDLYVDWPRKARDVVGKLRQAVGEYPDDPHLASLIGELTMRSPQFATLWAEHRVRAWGMAEYRMRHPMVGELDVLQHSLPVPREPGIRVVVTTAAPGSAAQAALQLLNQTLQPAADMSAIARPAADTSATARPAADTPARVVPPAHS